jgi:hypothetical protein
MTASPLDRPLEPPLADSPDMPEYEGLALITREPDMEEPPYYREPHSTVGRFIGHREREDGSFVEASPVEAWTDVDEATGGHERAHRLSSFGWATRSTRCIRQARQTRRTAFPGRPPDNPRQGHWRTLGQGRLYNQTLRRR